MEAENFHITHDSSHRIYETNNFPSRENGYNSTEWLYVQVSSCFTEDSTTANEITTVFLQLNDSPGGGPPGNGVGGIFPC